MRMARDRGEGDADTVLQKLTSDQVAELLALEELEPRGPNRDDLRFARLACWLISAIPFRGKDAQQPKESDVFATLRVDPVAAAMSGDQIAAQFHAMGAKRVKKGQKGSGEAEKEKPPTRQRTPKPPGKKPNPRKGTR